MSVYVEGKWKVGRKGPVQVRHPAASALCQGKLVRGTSL